MSFLFLSYLLFLPYIFGNVCWDGQPKLQEKSGVHQDVQHNSRNLQHWILVTSVFGKASTENCCCKSNCCQRHLTNKLAQFRNLTRKGHRNEVALIRKTFCSQETPKLFMECSKLEDPLLGPLKLLIILSKAIQFHVVLRTDRGSRIVGNNSTLRISGLQSAIFVRGKNLNVRKYFWSYPDPQIRLNVSSEIHLGTNATLEVLSSKSGINSWAASEITYHSVLNIVRNGKVIIDSKRGGASALILTDYSFLKVQDADLALHAGSGSTSLQLAKTNLNVQHSFIKITCFYNSLTSCTGGLTGCNSAWTVDHSRINIKNVFLSNCQEPFPNVSIKQSTLSLEATGPPGARLMFGKGDVSVEKSRILARFTRKLWSLNRGSAEFYSLLSTQIINSTVWLKDDCKIANKKFLLSNSLLNVQHGCKLYADSLGVGEIKITDSSELYLMENSIFLSYSASDLIILGVSHLTVREASSVWMSSARLSLSSSSALELRSESKINSKNTNIELKEHSILTLEGSSLKTTDGKLTLSNCTATIQDSVLILEEGATLSCINGLISLTSSKVSVSLHTSVIIGRTSDIIGPSRFRIQRPQVSQIILEQKSVCFQSSAAVLFQDC